MDHGPIEILLTCAEEVGLRGMKGFDTSLLTSRYAFVFDSDGAIGRIILQAPFHSTITLSVAGKAAHACAALPATESVMVEWKGA